MSVLICATAMAARGAVLGEPLVFSGTCDASAAVALDNDLFVVANDEDNFLRFYRLDHPGKPVLRYDLKSILSSGRKSPEADLEGAARFGQKIFFISSHGRTDQGKPAPHRHRLFALEMTQREGEVIVQPFGKPYSNLVADLARDPRFARFRLTDAASRSPDTGGLNIEAMTGTPHGTLLIGFRSPIPERRALLVPLLNPNQLITGQLPEFGEPILLDLGGRGLRGIGSTARGYYLLAGPANKETDYRLFFWEGGSSEPRVIVGVNLRGINPEGICFQDTEGRAGFLILSDDGSRKLNGKDCKSLPEAERQFRAYRLTP